MMISDPWGLLLNQSGGGSIDMSRGFSGFGNLPPLDWMPNPGAEHGVDVGGQFPWNVADSYTYFRWYESVLFKRAREEDRRLLLGDFAKTTRMLLAGKFDEIQLDTSAAPRWDVNGVEYELRDIGGFKVWLRVNPFAPHSQGGQPTAPPKSMPDWLEQFAPPSPLDPTASPPPAPTAAPPTSSPLGTPPARDPRGQDLQGLLSWAPLSAPSTSPIPPTWVPPANGPGAATMTPIRGPQPSGASRGDTNRPPAPPNAVPRRGSPTVPFDPMADSPFASWLLYGRDTPVRDFLTNDTHLKYAEYTFGAIAIGAAVIATGGILAGGSAFGYGGGTLAISAPSVGTISTSVTAAAAIAKSPGFQQELQQLETLAPELESALPAELSAAGQLAQNFSRGTAFQSAVTKTFGLVRNTTTMLGETIKGSLRPTILDVYAGGVTPMADIKDVLRLFFTRQLQAQASVARMSNTSFNIIVSSRNIRVSDSLANAVQASGGFIFRVNAPGVTPDVWDAVNRVWVPFLIF